MATKSKWQRTLRTGGDLAKRNPDLHMQQNIEDSTADMAPPVPSQLPTPSETATTIRKGVYFSALIYVEGDLPPSADFTAPATQALKDALAEALKSNPGGLSMTLKKVEVQNDVEQNDSDTGTDGGKFQF